MAPKPWRASIAEKMLLGAAVKPDSFVQAAAAELAAAVPRSGNAFKVELSKRTIVAVLTELAASGDKRP